MLFVLTSENFKAFPGIEVPISLAETSSPKFGDYQCNSAMIITKELKASGVNKRPAEVGALLKENLPSCELIDKVCTYDFPLFCVCLD